MTPLTAMLGCKYPIMLAGVQVTCLYNSGPRSLPPDSFTILEGMYSVGGHELCVAVSNAGGVGCIGGLSYTPSMLRKEARNPLCCATFH